MKKLFIFGGLALFLAACNKDKFKTQPTVTINSFGPAQVNLGDAFTLNATVTDKEGDLQDSVLLVEKLSNPVTNDVLRTDTVPFSLQTFGIPTSNQIQLSAVFVDGRIVNGAMTYTSDDQSVDRNLAIGIIVIDNAGHRSDYVESNKILLKKL